MNKKAFHLFLLIAAALNIGVTDANENLKIENSIQTGVEYDTNVFKTFSGSEQDFLTRLLLQSKGDYWVNQNFTWGWDYQGGGKKFIHDDAQDQIIQSVAVPLRFALSAPVQILLEPDFKYQNENNKLDAGGDDVNEDFLSTKSQVRIFVALPHRFFLIPQGAFTYFHFYPDQTFSFYREEMGLSVEKRIQNFTLGLSYDYLRQQFQNSFRVDSIQEVSPYLQFMKTPFVSLRYTYQTNHSNDPVFSFTNHKISLLSSFLFGKYKTQRENLPSAMFSLHFIGTLQLKNYSSVTAETPEGERFLVTSSEEENFNNLIVKFNYHFYKKWSFETKYTRVSNDLTNQATHYARSLYYAGLRYDF